MKKNLHPFIWGLTLIVIGILVLLNIAGVTNINLWSYIVGIVFIVGGSGSIINSKKNIFGYFLILVGAFIIIKKVLELKMNALYIFPAIIIATGISFLFSIFTFKENVSTHASSFMIFSSRVEKTFSPNFKGKSITCIFGGYDIDLRDHIFHNDMQFNIFTIFGGTDIFVPENVNIELNPTSIFGGVSNVTNNKNDNEFTIYINALTLFGGVGISNTRK